MPRCVVKGFKIIRAIRGSSSQHTKMFLDANQDGIDKFLGNFRGKPVYKGVDFISSIH